MKKKKRNNNLDLLNQLKRIEREDTMMKGGERSWRLNLNEWSGGSSSGAREEKSIELQKWWNGNGCEGRKKKKEGNELFKNRTKKKRIEIKNFSFLKKMLRSKILNASSNPFTGLKLKCEFNVDKENTKGYTAITCDAEYTVKEESFEEFETQMQSSLTKDWRAESRYY